MDGATIERRTGSVSGTYVHGLFASDDPFRARASSSATEHRHPTDMGSMEQPDLDVTLDALADRLADHLDTAGILHIARRGGA